MWIISKTLCHLKEKYKKLYVYQVRILSLFSCSVMTNSLWPHGLQDTRLPHPSPTLRVCSNSCPLSCDTIQASHSLSSPSPAFNLWVRFFSTESVLRIMWSRYWSFSFRINLSNEYSGPASFRIDWFDLLAVLGTLKSLLQHHSSKASILLFWRHVISRCFSWCMLHIS